MLAVEKRIREELKKEEEWGSVPLNPAIYGPDVYADISDLPILNDINGGGMTVREARELIAEIDRLRAIEVASRKMIEAILGGLTQFGSGI